MRHKRNFTVKSSTAELGFYDFKTWRTRNLGLFRTSSRTFALHTLLKAERTGSVSAKPKKLLDRRAPKFTTILTWGHCVSIFFIYNLCIVICLCKGRMEEFREKQMQTIPQNNISSLPRPIRHNPQPRHCWDAFTTAWLKLAHAQFMVWEWPQCQSRYVTSMHSTRSNLKEYLKEESFLLQKDQALPLKPIWTVHLTRQYF